METWVRPFVFQGNLTFSLCDMPCSRSAFHLVQTCLFLFPTVFVNQDSTNDLPYNFGPANSWNVSSTYLSPYDWLYGPYAPPFWSDNFEALALSEVRCLRPASFTCGAVAILAVFTRCMRRRYLVHMGTESVAPSRALEATRCQTHLFHVVL